MAKFIFDRLQKVDEDDVTRQTSIMAYDVICINFLQLQNKLRRMETSHRKGDFWQDRNTTKYVLHELKLTSLQE